MILLSGAATAFKWNMMQSYPKSLWPTVNITQQTHALEKTMLRSQADAIFENCRYGKAKRIFGNWIIFNPLERDGEIIATPIVHCTTWGASWGIAHRRDDGSLGLSVDAPKGLPKRVQEYLEKTVKC